MDTFLNGVATADRERDQAILSAAFELTDDEVSADAHALVTSPLPRDELLAALCAAHQWQSEMGVIYLAHLTRAVNPGVGRLPGVWCGD